MYVITIRQDKRVPQGLEETEELVQERYPNLCHLATSTITQCLRHNQQVYGEIAVKHRKNEVTICYTILRTPEDVTEMLKLIWMTGRTHDVLEIRAAPK